MRTLKPKESLLLPSPSIGQKIVGFTQRDEGVSRLITLFFENGTEMTITYTKPIYDHVKLTLEDDKITLERIPIDEAKPPTEDWKCSFSKAFSSGEDLTISQCLFARERDDYGGIDCEGLAEDRDKCPMWNKRGE